MRWDGQAYTEDIKFGLQKLLSDEDRENARIMSHIEFASLFKEHCGDRLECFSRFPGSGSIIMKCDSNGIEFDFQRPLNNSGETKITLSWSMAARHIRAWEYEERTSAQQKNIPQKKSVNDQWDNTHLCRNYTDNYTVEARCEYFLQTKSEDTVINGRKLDRSCYYCTSENKIRKIGSGGSWTGLSPKFCPKRKALEEQRSMCDDCANNNGSCLKPTKGECVRYVSTIHLDELLFLAKHAGYKASVTDFLDKFLQKYPNFDANRFEELKPFLKTEGINKTAPPTYTVGKEEDKMTPNFNFKGFISEGNQLKQVPLDMLVPYHNHKFKLYEGERLADMVNSIKENGVLTPIIVRNMGGEHYEILAGHNRTNAARIAGLSVIPAIVKENLSDDEAEMYVIETNVMQRGFDDLSISERAAVIAARHSAMFDEDKRKAIERELAALNGNTPADEDEEQENGEKKSKLAAVGESYGLSKDSVARLIRIDKLSDELKSYVDSGDIPLRAGVNLSYLLPSEQKMLIRIMIDCVNTKISMKQSELLRELSREKNLTENNVREVVLTGKLTDHSAPAPRKPIKVKISADIGAKYFSPNWDEDKVRQIVELALEQYFTNTDRLIMDENDEYQI